MSVEFRIAVNGSLRNGVVLVSVGVGDRKEKRGGGKELEIGTRWTWRREGELRRENGWEGRKWTKALRFQVCGMDPPRNRIWTKMMATKPCLLLPWGLVFGEIQSSSNSSLFCTNKLRSKFLIKIKCKDINFIIYFSPFKFSFPANKLLDAKSKCII